MEKCSTPSDILFWLIPKSNGVKLFRTQAHIAQINKFQAEESMAKSTRCF